MSIESLDQFVNHCAACIYLTHHCYKFKEEAYCEKWKKSVPDLFSTCIHFKKNPDLPSIDDTPLPKKKRKRVKQPEETVSFFFDYQL